MKHVKVIMLLWSILLASPLPTTASTPMETIPTLPISDSFIYYGIVATITEEMKNFTKKYNVGFTNAGCLMVNKSDTEAQNLAVANRLSQILGHDEWKKDLPFTIMGVN